MNILIINIKSLAGIRDAAVKHVKGTDLKNLPSLGDAFLFIQDGRISSFGQMNEISSQEFLHTQFETIDAIGRIVMPCYCDSHTHLVFADTRENEFVDKINGLTYEQIAARGGGILNSAARLSEAPEELLLENAFMRIENISKQGTGAVEIKSGYGLSYEGEMKMLRVINRLKSISPIPIKATFLGAHALSASYKDKREEYIKMLTDRLMPKIAEERLADYCDVFCEKGFF